MDRPVPAIGDRVRLHGLRGRYIVQSYQPRGILSPQDFEAVPEQAPPDGYQVLSFGALYSSVIQINDGPLIPLAAGNWCLAEQPCRDCKETHHGR